MMKIGSRILFVLVLLHSVVAAGPTAKTYLHLPNVPQKLDSWCWAASAQMVKNAARKIAGAPQNVQQCAEANKQLGLAFCCPVPTDQTKRDQCDQVGFPEFAKPQAPDFKSVYSENTPPRTLPWETIKDEIDAKRPFVHMRQDPSGGGHFVVIQGYGRTDDVRYIRVNDPWPKNKGKTYWQTYSWYS